MKSISFILHFIIVLCMPSVVWAGGVSSVADSLYRKAEKEQSFAAYSEVLDYMIGEGETGSIYDNSLRRLQKLSEGTKDVGRKAAVLRYQAHSYPQGSSDFFSNMRESMRCYALARDKEGEAKVCDELGTAYLYADQDSALHYLDRGISLLDGTENVDKASMINTRGIIKYYRGDVDGGLSDFKIVVGMLDRCGVISPLPSMAQNIAALYDAKDMYDSAIVYFDRAIQYCATTGNHAPEPVIYSNIASLYTKTDNYKQALLYADKAVQASERYPDNYVDRVQSLHSRAGVKKAMKDFDGAKSDFKAAMGIARKAAAPQLMLKPLPGLLSIYVQEENQDSAAYLAELGSVYADSIGSITPEVANYHEVLAEYYAWKGDHRAALDNLLVTYESGVSTMPRRELMSKLAGQYAALGIYDKAYAMADSAYMDMGEFHDKKMADSFAGWDAKFRNQEHKLEIERMKAEKQRVEFALAAGLMLVILLVMAIVFIRRNLRRKAELESARKYVEGLETERQRISRELHDGVCNDLLGVQLLGRLAHNQEQIQEMLEYLDRSREDVRRISHDLASPGMERSSLRELIYTYICQFRKGSAKNIELDYSITNEPEAVKAANIYRIVQELVANAVKYSTGSDISVEMKEDAGRLYVTVYSDGDFKKNPGVGIGLKSVNNRVMAMEGSIETGEDCKGHYTKIVLSNQ